MCADDKWANNKCLVYHRAVVSNVSFSFANKCVPIGKNRLTSEWFELNRNSLVLLIFVQIFRWLLSHLSNVKNFTNTIHRCLLQRLYISLSPFHFLPYVCFSLYTFHSSPLYHFLSLQSFSSTRPPPSPSPAYKTYNNKNIAEPRAKAIRKTITKYGRMNQTCSTFARIFMYFTYARHILTRAFAIAHFFSPAHISCSLLSMYKYVT